MDIYPFLSFNGNCSEAMHFYRECFGGDLHLNYLIDTPGANSLPAEMAHLIVSASLISGHIKLFASDLIDEEGIALGNRISLLFSSSLNRQFKSLFNKLSRKGIISCPISDNMHTGEWASLTDQYGVQWIFASKTSHAFSL